MELPVALADGAAVALADGAAVALADGAAVALADGAAVALADGACCVSGWSCCCWNYLPRDHQGLRGSDPQIDFSVEHIPDQVRDLFSFKRTYQVR